MAFSDSDLTRLKERKSAHATYRIIELMGVEFDALLHRLECAEEVINALPRLEASEISADDYLAIVKKWANSKGEGR